MSADTDKSSLYDDLRDFFGKKAEEAGDETDDEQTGSADDAGQKSDEDDDGQKQAPGDDGGDGSAVDDLVRALADELGEDPDDLMAAIKAGDFDGEEDEEEEDDDDDEGDVEQDADESADANVSIDFGAKADEHGLVNENTLDDRLSSMRESIVEDVGEKLAETNKEAVDEIAQKMNTAGTPTPAGGSFQDEQDFETHLEEIADKEDW